MTFMVVDIDSYNLLFGLNFLIKIGIVVDVEKGIIQVRQGPGNNIQVLPLSMVNMLQVVKDKTQHDHMKNLEKEMRNATINVEELCFDEYIRWSSFDSSKEAFDDEEYRWNFFEMT
jgi:hypothetical protein